jgi:iron-sulfur cluster assembly accessory protein
MTEAITKDMTIGDMVQKYPSAVEVLLEEGVHCVGCGAAYFETIEQGLAGHGKTEEEIDNVLKKLNKSIPKEEGNEELIITENAISKVKSLLEKKENKNEALRVKVTSGGCSGNQYQFEFTSEKNENDNEIKINGVSFIIDKESMEQLKGSKIDYVDALTGAGFKISNPNAKSTCGCGQSFN